MNKLIAALTVMAFLIVASQVQANCGSCGDEGKCATKKTEKKDSKGEKKDQAVTITGKITKEVKKNKSDKEVVKYLLVDSKGTKVHLPEKSTVKYEDYVGVEVKVTGTGTAKKDGTVNKLKSITTIEKVTAPAPAAAETK